ncbi:MAG: hypothetical protein IT353_01745 [Gemmatimonadaceae bacterium]|nr:hypothetical protein [Gemmatimonadaceae bacterium]
MTDESATPSTAPVAGPAAKRAKRAKRTKKRAKKEPATTPSPTAAKRTVRDFPASSFEEALELAKAAFDYGSGKPVRRLSLFDHLGKSPESGPSRQWITNANKYGLMSGSYKADQLELTQDGLRAVGEDTPSRERARVRVKLAVEDIPPFSRLYERFAGNKLPVRNAMVDAIQEFDVPIDQAEEAVDTFVVNLRFLGLLQTLSGAERIVSIDHLLDTLPATTSSAVTSPLQARVSSAALITASQAQYETTCFYVAPIGAEGSEQRRHSDLMLGSLVEPAMEQFQIKVLRADAIDKPGIITRQVIEYLLRARLVIADLSFHNPNVFYELAIRHASRLPAVQIIRTADRIPFDLNQSRTVVVDTTDIYSLVPRIDSYRAEIANQVRRALEDPDSVDNPITAFHPSFRVEVDSSRGAG